MDSENNHLENFPHPAELVFIAGDIDAGLVITGQGEAVYSFQYKEQTITAETKTRDVGDNVVAQTITLAMEEPVRFRIEWFVPENAQNAAMTLNGNLLISPMAVWPEDGPLLPKPECGNDTPVSTLHAGQFQSLNFRWENHDKLTLYLVVQR
ncbi:MAG: hypothetical protein GX749_00360 [Ruminococcaceae bacterium]|nr:hypothetical protein [Oscillospiraceae bacterium]